MERLTRRVGANEAIPIFDDYDICEPFKRAGKCQTGCLGGVFSHWERHCNDTCPIGVMIDSLAAYEDAEEQGLLVRLPCKLGDNVYAINDQLAVQEFSVAYIQSVPSGEMAISAECTQRAEGCVCDSFCGIRFTEINMRARKIFLTRQEAEKALEVHNGLD